MMTDELLKPLPCPKCSGTQGKISQVKNVVRKNPDDAFLEYKCDTCDIWSPSVKYSLTPSTPRMNADWIELHQQVISKWNKFVEYQNSLNIIPEVPCRKCGEKLGRINSSNKGVHAMDITALAFVCKCGNEGSNVTYGTWTALTEEELDGIKSKCLANWNRENKSVCSFG